MVVGLVSVSSLLSFEKEGMRILLIAEPTASKNGWSRYASALCEALATSGDEARVLGWMSKEEGASISFSEFGLWSAFFKPWLLARGWQKVQVSLGSWRPEAVHVIVEPYLLYGVLIAWFYRVPLVMTVHGTYADPSALVYGWKRSWVKWWFSLGLRKCAKIVCVSHFTERFFLERWPFMTGKTEVVHPGATRLPEPIEKSSPQPEVAPDLLVVGALKERRGQVEAVQILAKVQKRYPLASLTLVGSTQDQAYVARVQGEIQQLSDPASVQILSGMMSDEELAVAYEETDVLLMPSRTIAGRFEGFGLVALEANQFGKPVVAMAGSGVEDAVIPGVTGMLVSANDVEACAQAVIQLIQQPLSPDRIQQSLASRTWKQTTERIHSLYEHSISSAR